MQRAYIFNESDYMTQDYGHVRKCHFGEEKMKSLTVILSMPSSCLQTSGETDTWHVILGSHSTLIGTSVMRSSMSPMSFGWKQKSPSLASLVSVDTGRPTSGGPILHDPTGGAVLVVQPMLGFPPVTLSLAQL